MYEYVDARGERVTVRSARTLGALLGDGRITAATRFRRAEEPAFVPAAGHGELRRIADEAGVPLGPSPEPEPEAPQPGPAAAAPAPPPSPGPAAVEAPAPAAPAQDAAAARKPGISPWVPRRPQPAGTAGTQPPAEGGASAAEPPARPAGRSPFPATPHPQPQPLPRRGSVPTAGTPVALIPLGEPARVGRVASAASAPVAAPSPETRAMAAVRWISVSLLHGGAAALASAVAAAAMLAATRSEPLGLLALVAAAVAAGRFAGRRMGERRLAPAGWEAVAGTVLAGAVATLVAGRVGLLLGIVVGVALWLGLKRRSALPPRG